MTTMIIIIITMYPLLGIWVRIDVLFKHPAFGSMTTHTSTVAIHLIYPIMYHLLSSLSLSLDLLISTKKMWFGFSWRDLAEKIASQWQNSPQFPLTRQKWHFDLQATRVGNWWRTRITRFLPCANQYSCKCSCYNIWRTLTISIYIYNTF
jgi:hypothetical protein